MPRPVSAIGRPATAAPRARCRATSIAGARVARDRLERLEVTARHGRLLARGRRRSGSRGGRSRTRAARRWPTARPSASCGTGAGSGRRRRRRARGCRPEARRPLRRRGGRAPRSRPARRRQLDAVDLDADDRAGDAVERRGRLGTAGEHLVEVECLSERLDDARPERVLAHPLDGRRRARARERPSARRSPAGPCRAGCSEARRRADHDHGHRGHARRAPRPRRGVRGRRCSSARSKPTRAAFADVVVGDELVLARASWRCACTSRRPASRSDSSVSRRRRSCGEPARHRHGGLDVRRAAASPSRTRAAR